MDTTSSATEPVHYELHFNTLFGSGRAFSFPCDASGQVDQAALSETGRRNYRLACSTIGREVALPEVRVIHALDRS